MQPMIKKHVVGLDFSDRKPNGTIHYVEAKTAQRVEIRLYEDLILDFFR
jgi:glutaminyl-tRNA synthetase